MAVVLPGICRQEAFPPPATVGRLAPGGTNDPVARRARLRRHDTVCPLRAVGQRAAAVSSWHVQRLWCNSWRLVRALMPLSWKGQLLAVVRCLRIAVEPTANPRHHAHHHPGYCPLSVRRRNAWPAVARRVGPVGRIQGRHLLAGERQPPPQRPSFHSLALLCSPGPPGRNWPLFSLQKGPGTDSSLMRSPMNSA